MNEILPQMNISLSFDYLSFGETVYLPGSTFGPRNNIYFHFFLVHAGEATVEIDDQPVHVPAGYVLLTLPGHKQYFHFAAHQRTHHSWCTFGVKNLDGTLLEAFADLPLRLPCSQNMDQFFSLGKRNIMRRTPNHGLILGKLAECVLIEFLAAAQWGAGKEDLLPEAIFRVQQYIDQHYDESLTLKDLGRVAHVTPPHLIRLFRRYLNLTPIHYLWQVRMRYGIQLLRETGLSIEEIAWRTGFKEPSHFSKAIKRHYQMSPKHFRSR